MCHTHIQSMNTSSPNWCRYDPDDYYITDSSNVVWLNWEYLEYEAGPGGRPEETYEHLVETRLKEFSEPVFAGPYEGPLQGPLEAPKPYTKSEVPF